MNEFIQLVKEDLMAYDESIKSIKRIKLKDFLYRYIKTPGFKVTTWMRICNWLNNYKALKVFYFLARLLYRHYQAKYGIQIGFRLAVKGGFCINHYGGIVIGESPIIGDNVSCGPGVIIIGKVHIGNNVLIGAGTIVVKDIPSNSVVVGNPGKVIKKIDPTKKAKI